MIFSSIKKRKRDRMGATISPVNTVGNVSCVGGGELLNELLGCFATLMAKVHWALMLSRLPSFGSYFREENWIQPNNLTMACFVDRKIRLNGSGWWRRNAEVSWQGSAAISRTFIYAKNYLAGCETFSDGVLSPGQALPIFHLTFCENICGYKVWG